MLTVSIHRECVDPHVSDELAPFFCNTQKTQGHLNLMRDSATNCVLALRLTKCPTFTDETLCVCVCVSERSCLFGFRSVSLCFAV